jgi:BlaI family penicillinase repressor
MSGKSKKRPANSMTSARAAEAKSISISDAEWEVMELLWEAAPRTSADLCGVLEQTKRWKRATIMTLLSRLIGKGVVATTGEGRPWQYVPAVPRESCVARETRGFLDRMFSGALLPMVAHCIEHHQLSAREIAELRALLDQAPVSSPPAQTKRKPGSTSRL